MSHEYNSNIIVFCLSRSHGISRTDFNLLSDPELSFMEVISKIPSNPINKGIKIIIT